MEFEKKKDVQRIWCYEWCSNSFKETLELALESIYNTKCF